MSSYSDLAPRGAEMYIKLSKLTSYSMWTSKSMFSWITDGGYAYCCCFPTWLRYGAGTQGGHGSEFLLVVQCCQQGNCGLSQQDDREKENIPSRVVDETHDAGTPCFGRTLAEAYGAAQEEGCIVSSRWWAKSVQKTILAMQQCVHYTVEHEQMMQSFQTAFHCLRIRWKSLYIGIRWQYRI